MSALASFEEKATNYPGSTRTVGIMRIGLALLAWAEMGDLVTVKEGGFALSALFYTASTAMLIGYRSQIATFATAIALWITINKIPATNHHHTYIECVATTVLALTPCGKSFSLDRWLAVRAEKNGPAPAEEGNLWAIRLICLQMSALFFWGGYNKVTLGTQSFQSAFLSGDRLEQTLIYYYSLPIPMPGWMSTFVMLLATSVTMFEMFSGIGLWIPKVRPYVLLGCLLMTSSFQALLSVRTFGFLSALLYLAFVPPAKVHAIVERALGVVRPAALMRMGVAFLTLGEIGEIIHPRKANTVLAFPLLISTFAMAAGFKSRFACIATAASVAVVAVLAPETPKNAWELVAAAAILALTRCGDSLSIDRYLAKEPAPATEPEWPIKVVMAGLTAVCLWSAYSQYQLGTTMALGLSMMMAVGGVAAWHPKLRFGGLGAALFGLVGAHFFLALPSQELLLAMTFSLSVVPLTAVTSAANQGNPVTES